MSILGVNGALAGAYQYANRTQKAGTSRTGFTEQLQKTGEAANTSKVDTYTEYLRQKIWCGCIYPECTKRSSQYRPVSVRELRGLEM